MSYPQFLRDLLESGRVTVPGYAEVPADQLHYGEALLIDLECRQRLEAPGEPPPFSPTAASWAGLMFFRASQFILYRDLGQDLLERELSRKLQQPLSPEVVYSVDLVFRYLPDLMRFAQTASSTDPLLEHLRRWARQWPLSSVGATGDDEVSIDSFADHPSLLTLYVDRVLASGDKSRLADPRARAALRQGLGMYPELAGALASDLCRDNLSREPTT